MQMSIETAKMSERGQIIIPKEIREFIEAEENTIFTIMPLDKDTIIMKKLDKAKLISEFRDLRSSVKKLSPVEIDKEITDARRSKR